MGAFRNTFACVLLALVFFRHNVEGQVVTFPYVERFDSVVVPALPSGWLTTTNRLSSGDFFSTTTAPRSSPCAVQSTNSTIPQSLVSGVFDFTNRIPDTLRFYAARSGTHTSGLIVEASIDSGATFPVVLSDTIQNPGTTNYLPTSFLLPASLSGQPRVRIRWHILGGSGGTTATLRIDDVSVSVLRSFDLSLASLRAEPSPATTATPVTLTARVENLGVFSVTDYRVDFFLDANKDGRGELSELFSTVSGSPLAPNSPTEFSVTHPPLPPETHRFLAAVSFDRDEVAANNQASVTVNVGVPPGTVVVNEIMYAPAGDEPEWVEILNTTTAAVNLKNWKISDSNSSSKTLLTASDLFLDPLGYALVAKDSEFVTVHPNVGVPVVIGNFSALNNTSPDAVVLFDYLGMAVDSVFYFPSWGGQDGKSLERVDEFGNSNDPPNWMTSIDSTGRTPGRTNSVARLEYDLAVHSVSVSGTFLTVEVKNSGRRHASEFVVQLFSDLNRNGMPEAHEQIVSLASTDELQAGSMRSLFYDWASAPQGEVAVLIRVEFGPDQRLSNNAATAFIVSRFTHKSLVVNEILYEPLSGQNEWVEFYHRGGLPIDLQRWSFNDRPTGSGNRNTFAISATSLDVEAGEYVVVAADSTILSLYPGLASSPRVHLIILNRSGGFSLGNEGDDIVLYDLTGSIIDSVSYSPGWHNPSVTDTRGRSLERINPDIDSNDRRNWSTSARLAGGTPGSQNSLYTKSLRASATLTITPNPFSPDGDGFEDVCIVRYQLPFSTSIIRVRIFDLRGRMIRLLADGEPAGPQGELIWDGFDDHKRSARIGPHIILIEAVGDRGVVSVKSVVVVATKL